MPDWKEISSVVRRGMRATYPKITIEELAQRVGTSYDILNNQLNGRTPWRMDLLEKIRQALDMPQGWPLAEVAIMRRAREARVVTGSVAMETRSEFGVSAELQPIVPGKVVLVPLLGRISAGVVPVDPGADVDPEVGVLIPAEYATLDSTATYADGDSMLPLIQPGDKLVFRATPRPRLNRIVAVRKAVDGTKPLVKELRQIDHKLMLCSYNPDYPPSALEEGDTMLGYLTAVLSADGTLRIGPELGGINGAMLAGKLQERLVGWKD